MANPKASEETKEASRGQSLGRNALTCVIGLQHARKMLAEMDGGDETDEEVEPEKEKPKVDDTEHNHRVVGSVTSAFAFEQAH